MDLFRRPWARLVPLVVIGLGTLPATAQQEAPAASGAASKNDEHDKWVPLFRRHAGEYQIRVGTNGERNRRRADSRSRCCAGGNRSEVATTARASTYLWVSDRSPRSRPSRSLPCDSARRRTRSIVHERHSFGLGPDRGEWRGTRVWHTRGQA